MDKDMPAGYDPALDTEFGRVSELDSVFSGPPAAGASSANLDSELFGDSGENTDFGQGASGVKWPGSGRSIFEAAVSLEKQKERAAAERGDNIPAYAKALLREAEGDEDEDEEKDEDDSPDEDAGSDDGADPDFDFSDTDFDDDDLDIDSDDDEFDEPDDLELDDEDAAQTARWQEEDDVDEEMERLLGDDSPYLQGAGTSGQGLDASRSSTYANAKSSSSYIDDNLETASALSSGGFLEEFDDGFVLVPGTGATLAFAKPEDVDDEDANGVHATLVVRPAGAEEEDDEIFIDMTGEEIDALANALSAFRLNPNMQAAKGIMERARKRTRSSRRNR